MAAKWNNLTQRRREAAVAEKVRLGDIVDIIGGGTPSKKREDFYRGAIPWATVRDMNCDIIKKTEFCITDEAVENSATNVIPKGEVVISTHVGLGKVCVLGQDTAINQDLKAIIPHQGVFRRYMYYWFCSQADILIRNGKGATVKGVTLDFVRALQIPLPPLPAQRRIAAELDKICELKKNAETRLEKLDLLVKSRFVEMFGGPKLTDMLHPLVPIGELFNVGSSKRVFQKDWRSEGVPFYRAREVVKLSRDGHVDNELFISEEMFADYARQYGLPKPNDILVTGVGTLGVCYVVQKGDRFYYKDGNIICLNSKGLIDSTFVYHCYQQQFVRDQIDKNALGSTVGTYTIDSARKTLVPLPPPALQREFAAFVAKVDKLRLNVRETVAKMDMLYRSKLQEYFG